MRKEIVDILVRRDGITRNEAKNLIKECQEELKFCSSIDEAEDIIADYLGLEPDYLIDLLEV